MCNIYNNIKSKTDICLSIYRILYICIKQYQIDKGKIETKTCC